MSHSSSIPVAILGPTGYTGLELIEILSRHPSMHVAYLGSARVPAPRIDAGFRDWLHAWARASPPSARRLITTPIAKRVKLAFLCLPHEAAMEHAPKLLERGVKVVDLSAAYRIKDTKVYEQAYGGVWPSSHGSKNLEHGSTASPSLPASR